MKNVLIVYVYLVSNVAAIANQDEFPRPEPRGPLFTLSVPLTESAMDAFDVITAHLECTVEEYFQMVGVNVPRGGSCGLNDEDKSIRLVLDRDGITIAIMLIGDLLKYCTHPRWQPSKNNILRRYAFDGPPETYWDAELYSTPEGNQEY